MLTADSLAGREGKLGSSVVASRRAADQLIAAPFSALSVEPIKTLVRRDFTTAIDDKFIIKADGYSAHISGIRMLFKKAVIRILLIEI